MLGRRKGLAAFIVAIVLAGSSCSGAWALNPILWYNGDLLDGGVANERNTIVTDAAVFDDFKVTDPVWNLSSVFSNDLSNTAATSVDYEIRSGVSSGNGGVLVASGNSTVFSDTLTGRTTGGFNEHTYEIDGLNLHLNTGTYWLMVRPSDSGVGRSFVSNTDGANAVGTPPGNDDDAFFNSSYFSANFEPTTNLGTDEHDFSLGVRGTSTAPPAVPEPAFFQMGTLLAFAGFGVFRRRRRGPVGSTALA